MENTLLGNRELISDPPLGVIIVQDDDTDYQLLSESEEETEPAVPGFQLAIAALAGFCVAFQVCKTHCYAFNLV